MGKDTKIEWCDHTINLWWGCTKVHTGCDNCYAENTAHRWGNDVWGNDKYRKEIRKAFPTLDKIENEAKNSGKKAVVFVGSMQDIFEKPMKVSSTGKEDGEIWIGEMGNTKPLTTETLRKSLFARINVGYYSNIIFLFLTKRPSNISKYIPVEWQEKAPDNVWFGCSISDQKTADDLVKKLIEHTPKIANRFLSIEPQVGKIDLENLSVGNEHYLNCLTGITHYPLGNCDEYKTRKIHWIIQGGESGRNRRPFKLEWAYILKKQCKDAGTPYFFKQIDKIKPIPPDLFIRQLPTKFEKDE